jgi:hypothetical protein
MKGDNPETPLSTPRLGSAAPQSPPHGSSPREKAKALLRADPCDAAWANATIPGHGVDCLEEPL